LAEGEAIVVKDGRQAARQGAPSPPS
jgi:hypothetical protein